MLKARIVVKQTNKQIWAYDDNTCRELANKRKSPILYFYFKIFRRYSVIEHFDLILFYFLRPIHEKE